MWRPYDKGVHDARTGAGAREDGPSERYSQNGATEDERTAITRALAETGGARNTAAERLGMSRTTLWRKMKLYGLEGGDSVDVG